MRRMINQLTLLPLIGLFVVAAPQGAFGNATVEFQQSTQAPGAAGSGAGGENDVRDLEPGKPQRRELEARQRHNYRIRMRADEFLKVTIEQKGIDVVANLLGPDGKEVMDSDSESRLRGQESVWQVAETEGDYRLIVRPVQKAAPRGAYEVRIEELRAATKNDRALLEARYLYRKAIELHGAGKYDEALASIERAMEIRTRVLEPDHPDVVAAIVGQAICYSSKGEYSKAEPLYQQALDIREKTLGVDHPDVAASLNNLALLHRSKGDYEKAEQLFERALVVKERAFGLEHPEFASSLNNLAIIYRSKGDYEKAEPLYQRALAIMEKSLEPEDPNITSYLNNLALLYYYKGEYSKAEPFSQRALTIREKTLGPDNLKVAESLNSLALLYYSRGDYAKAEPLYQRALAIREKTLGPDNLDVAGSLNNLALLYHYRGDYEKAEPLYQRALAINEKRLEPEHPNIALYLNNLALLYCDRGEYSKAEPFYQRALSIREKALGPEHPFFATSLNNLANLYYSRGEYSKAEQFHQRALAIREKELEPEHPDVAQSLDNLGELFRIRGDYPKAEQFHQRALTIGEKTLGPEHPDVASYLDNLAVLNLAKNDIAQAIAFQSRANAVSERNLRLNLATSSERQILAYLATLSKQTDRTISLHLSNAPRDPVARSLAATLILQRKGRALDATSVSLNALRGRFNAEDRALLDSLTDARSQIARMVLDGPQGMPADQYRERIKTLEEQAEKFEAEISRRSDEFRARSLPITLEAVRAAIPDDAALIELASYRPFDPKAAKEDEAYGRPRYVAYVLRRQEEIQWKELGDAKAIDEAVARLRKAMRDPKRRDVKYLARVVDQKVFQPLRHLAGGLTRLLISPDGELNLIPYAALVDDRGRYMVERYSISYLSSGRDLLRLQTPRKSQSGPLVIADPDFGGRRLVEARRLLKQSKAEPKKAKAEPKRPTRDETPATAFSKFYFPALPYTAEEGNAIRSLLPNATLLTKRRANKAALEQVHSPAILHIATHGFFLEDLKLISTGERSLRKSPHGPSRRLKQVEKDGSRIENPLLRAGLALAGANEQKEGENGILTALEMTGLNLWGTKLVSLSACDTGVGEVRNGDGVHGLRRALALAGAETQVMSLWPVSDRWTRELMVAYYRGLQRGQGRAAALRQAQIEMLKDVKRRHPYYWASFIQSGEWANLNGKREK